MVLDDSSLASISIGVTASAGVLVAVIISVLVFVLDRRIRDSREALERVRRSGELIYGLIMRDPRLFERYISHVGIPDFEEFSLLIIRLSRAHSNEDLPDFFEWRMDTLGLKSGVLRTRAELEIMEEDMRLLDLEFVDEFWRLDSAIQFNELPKLLSEVSLKLRWAVRISGFILIASILTAILASVETSKGVSDQWNLPLVLMFLLLLLILLYTLISAAKLAGLSEHDLLRVLVQERIEKVSLMTRLKRGIDAFRKVSYGR